MGEGGGFGTIQASRGNGYYVSVVGDGRTRDAVSVITQHK
jgi:hypothetical protein